jgi:hypothetical protein
VPVETWSAGPEYDSAIQARLKAVLLELGYRPSTKWWGVGGSQEISNWEFTGALGDLTVEAETYVGLTITGPNTAISEVRTRMASRAVKA